MWRQLLLLSAVIGVALVFLLASFSLPAPEPQVPLATEMQIPTAPSQTERQWPSVNSSGTSHNVRIAVSITNRSSEGYMRIFGYHGQFANQMVTIAKAYSIALKLNRTLVEPEVMPSAQLYFRGGRIVPFFRLFDENTLRKGPVKFITAKEYSQLGIHGPKREYCYHKLCWCCENYIKGNPRWDTVPRCNCSTLDIEHRWPGPVEGFVVHPGFSFSNREGNSQPCTSASAIFRWLEPAARISEQLKELKKRLPLQYMGAHVRFTKSEVDALEYCRNKMKNFAWWYAEVRHSGWRPTGQECIATPAYVNCFRQDKAAPFFFSGDNKNTSALKLLEDSGGTMYKNPTGPSKLSVGELIVLDMMALRDAAIFLGNPLSSFSGFVCAMRRARHLNCTNLPPQPTQQHCIAVPDDMDAMLKDVKRHKPLKFPAFAPLTCA